MVGVLKQFCIKNNIVLCKGKNTKILLTLAWNRLMLLKLKLKKRLLGIHRPIVHYYAVCWNEEKMLPFMFDYYERFVDQFTIYDNYSDDGSETIIKSHKNARLFKFKSDGFNDSIHQNIKNDCWKRSRGKADFVIVCDMDEFLYHPEMTEFLNDAISKGYTLFHTEGYDMYSEKYPDYDEGVLLTEKVRRGIRHEYFDKPIVFDPNRIVEIRYEVGAHKAYPIGVVRKNNSSDTLKLLHYKNIGLKRLVERNRLYAARLSDENLQKEYGHEYLKEEQRFVDEFLDNEQKSTQVI